MEGKKIIALLLLLVLAISATAPAVLAEYDSSKEVKYTEQADSKLDVTITLFEDVVMKNQGKKSPKEFTDARLAAEEILESADELFDEYKSIELNLLAIKDKGETLDAQGEGLLKEIPLQKEKTISLMRETFLMFLEPEWNNTYDLLGEQLFQIKDLTNIKKYSEKLEEMNSVLEQMFDLAKDYKKSPFVSAETRAQFESIYLEIGNKQMIIECGPDFPDNDCSPNEYFIFSSAYRVTAPDSEYNSKLATFKTQVSKIKSELNSELCAGKDGSTQKLALNGIENDAAGYSWSIGYFISKISGVNELASLKDTLSKMQADFDKIIKDCEAAKALTKGENCTPAGNDQTDNSSKGAEWSTYDKYDAAYDELADDFEYYHEKYDDAVEEDDSSDIKKYKNELEDIQDEAEDLADDVEDLLDDVEDKDAIIDQKKLIDKLEDLSDDLESLQDDLTEVITGKSEKNSAVSTNSAAAFIPAKSNQAAVQNDNAPVTVEKLNFFVPQTENEETAAAAESDADFLTLALLVGGIAVAAVVIVFLLVSLLLRK
jgi:uncharacterized protein YoxC